MASRPVKSRLVVSLLAVALALALPAAHAGGTDQRAAAEEAGVDLVAPGSRPSPAPPTARREAGPLDLLLVPESTNDRVMAFDPTTGDLVEADFVPPDPDNLSTPIQAILGPDGASLLVSDQVDDVVQQYDLDGNYLGVFAPAGGADDTILDNVRGITLRDDGHLLVSVASGANADAVAEFDTSGNFVGNFVANGDGGLDSPWGLLVNGDVLQVTASTSDAVHEYDAATGAYLGDLRAIDSFPEQVALATGGNLVIGNFSGSEEGVVELAADGTLVGIYDPPEVGGNRGAYDLPNGNVLTTNGGGVHEIDRDGLFVETKIADVSARFITRIQEQACVVGLLVANPSVRPGEEIELTLTVRHHRLKTVTVPVGLWLEDLSGRVVTRSASAPITLRHGNVRHERFRLPVPEGVPAGAYRLVVGLPEMHQGAAWMERPIAVLP